MFDNDPDGNRQNAYRAKRRVAAEDRYLDKLERLVKLAEPLVGHLQGEKGFRYYINVRSAAGRLTGAIREFASEGLAIDYLIRNRYV
jgi:hypothetical protein